MFSPAPKHSPHELYEMRIAKTLAGFQGLEFVLKAYIAASRKAIRRLVDGNVDLSFAGTDFENYSLGQLISTFKKMNGNQDLIKSLQSVVKHRNQIAHRALLPLYSGKKLSDDECWNLIDEVSPLADHIQKDLDALQQELVNLQRIT